MSCETCEGWRSAVNSAVGLVQWAKVLKDQDQLRVAERKLVQRRKDWETHRQARPPGVAVSGRHRGTQVHRIPTDDGLAVGALLIGLVILASCVVVAVLVIGRIGL